MQEDAAHARGDPPHHADLPAQAGVLVAVLDHHLNNRGVQDVNREVKTVHLDIGAVPVRVTQHVSVCPGGGAVSHGAEVDGCREIRI